MDDKINIMIERMDFMSYMEFCLSVQIAYLSMRF